MVDSMTPSSESIAKINNSGNFTMPVRSDGSDLNRIGLFIAIVYLIQSIGCTIFSTMKLTQYLLEKNAAEEIGLDFNEDKEAGKFEYASFEDDAFLLVGSN